ncbi:MAG TPA: S8 family serine peptidase, partial [bacterium]|nr:S8 family serine peptidase [bacterium]
ELMATLKPFGCNLVKYLGDQGFVISFEQGADINRVKAQTGIQWIVPLHSRIKMDSNLAAEGIIEDVPILVHLFPDASSGNVCKSIERLLPDQPVQVGRSRIGFRCPRGKLLGVVSQIADLEDVFFVERDRGVVLLNRDAIRILQSGVYTGAAALFEKGLFGQGQIAAVCDTGIDADSCFFRDPSGTLPPTNLAFGTVVEATRRKVIAVNFLYSADQPDNSTHWDNQGHGTSVAGCIGGSHISDPTSSTNYNGMAPMAQFVIQDAGFQYDDCADLPGLGCPVIDLAPVFEQTYVQGARLHNNSWGDRENDLPHNTYTARCQDVDLFTWNHKDFLVVCAAGNEGTAFGAVTSPSVAKNALSVGGTNNGAQADSIIYFSSRGPASDGRIKPDLVAPASVLTARSDRNVLTGNCDLNSTQGTSFASPLTVGAACLVREYLQKGYAPTGVPRQENRMDSAS